MKLSALGASNPIWPIATTVPVHAQPETLFLARPITCEPTPANKVWAMAVPPDRLTWPQRQAFPIAISPKPIIPPRFRLPTYSEMNVTEKSKAPTKRLHIKLYFHAAQLLPEKSQS